MMSNEKDNKALMLFVIGFFILVLALNLFYSHTLLDISYLIVVVYYGIRIGWLEIKES